MYEPCWASPATIGEAVAALSDQEGDARPIAGGTDLTVLVRDGGVRPALLVDLGRVADLARIDVEGERVTLGATATHDALMRHPTINERATVLAQAARRVGSPQIRSRGTVGGNLANASPAADVAVALLALDSSVTAESGEGGVREIRTCDLFSGPGETVLRQSELLTEVAFEVPSSDARSVYVKMGQRNALAIAIVSVAVVHEPERGTVRIALGSVAPTPLRATEAERLFESRWGAESDIEALIVDVARRAAEATHTIDDVRATAAFRRELAGTLARRALRSVCL